MACNIIRSLVVTSYGTSSVQGEGLEWPPNVLVDVSCFDPRNCLIDVEDDGQLALLLALPVSPVDKLRSHGTARISTCSKTDRKKGKQ